MELSDIQVTTLDARVKRFRPRTTPNAPEIIAAIEDWTVSSHD